SGATVDLAGAIDGQGGIAKLGPGRATFKSANTYAGVTNVYEGALRITDSGALGVGASNTPSQGTVVFAGAALEIDGSAAAVSVTQELLSLNGLGAGYGNTNAFASGFTGALRNIAGSNTWAGNILTNTINNSAFNNEVDFGVDAGTLTVS